MSSESVKKNESNADPSVSQKCDIGNKEEPESSSCRGNEEREPPKTGENTHKDLDSSNILINNNLCNTKYFIIKSLNHDNIQLSVQKGIWATQVMNEPILEDAFHNCDKVILIFSVNSSGYFQGYAQMMSSVGQRRDNVWTQGSGANNPWGRSFRVKWLRLSNLAFHKTLHLKNPLNEYKPVKISRDCQELSPEIGEALCQLIDSEPEEDWSLERDMYLVSKPGMQSGYCFPEEGYMASPMDNMTWATTNMMYPSYLYQYHASGSLLAHHGSVDVFPPENSLAMGRKGSLSGHTHQKGSNLILPTEMSPLCSTLSEDEFLEMSYEEYLEAHARGIKQAGRKSRKKEDSSSKEEDDDSHSHSEHGSSHKRSRH